MLVVSLDIQDRVLPRERTCNASPAYYGWEWNQNWSYQLLYRYLVGVEKVSLVVSLELQNGELPRERICHASPVYCGWGWNQNWSYQLLHRYLVGVEKVSLVVSFDMQNGVLPRERICNASPAYCGGGEARAEVINYFTGISLELLVVLSVVGMHAFCMYVMLKFVEECGLSYW